MERTAKTELLAPAGSYEAFRAGLAAGADAFYLGGTRFGARAFADNFTEEVLCRTIDEAHVLGKKIYLTVNTLMKEAELEELYSFLLPFYRQGLDAVIVQDVGAMQMIREAFPGLAIHASTQMTVTGREGAALLEEYGAARVVPARELSLEEIRQMRAYTGLEIECFVHGALCYCYSGQCLMSSFIGGRSGNRGRCAQPCRLPYQAFADGKKISNANRQYLLNTKDICLIDYVADLVEAGITSFKIEGRMKRPEYTAGVVSVYRKYLDRYEQEGKRGKASKEDAAFLEALFNRDGFSSSYYFRHNGPEMMALENRRISEPRMKQAEAAYAAVRSEILTREPKRPVSGRFCVLDNFTAELEVTDGTISVRSVSSEVQASQNRPLEEAAVRRQLMKTGGTPFAFTDLRIELAENMFLTMKQLNELRRDALAAFSEELLRSARRETPPVLPEKPAVPDAGKTDQPRLWISVETEAQLSAARQLKDKAGVYLPLSLMKKSQTAAFVRENRARIMIALPYISRSDARAPQYQARLLQLAEDGFGFLVRSFEDAAFLIRSGFAGAVRLDDTMYTMNSRAMRFWREYGISETTVPVELNKNEIRQRDNRDSDLIIYGRLPLMVSAQCIRKNLTKCTGNGGTMILKDRKNVEFPVSFSCDSCYNILYNSVPVSLFGRMDELKQLRAARYRVILTTEDAAQTGEILRMAGRAAHGSPVKEPFSFTRGHFSRGVE